MKACLTFLVAGVVTAASAWPASAQYIDRPAIGLGRAQQVEMRYGEHEGVPVFSQIRHTRPLQWRQDRDSSQVSRLSLANHILAGALIGGIAAGLVSVEIARRHNEVSHVPWWYFTTGAGAALGAIGGAITYGCRVRKDCGAQKPPLVNPEPQSSSQTDRSHRSRSLP